MVEYEYRVIPAPAKGQKARGIKGPEARFAHAVELKINEMASEGWEYQRSDILPSEERQGLTSSHTVYRTLLVFRRAVEAAPDDTVIDDRAADAVETDDADDDIIAEDETAPEDAEAEPPSDEAERQDDKHPA